MSKKLRLLAISLFTTALTLNLFLIPPLQNPDESYHFATVESTMEGGPLIKKVTISSFLISAVVSLGLPHIFAPMDRISYLNKIGNPNGAVNLNHMICPSSNQKFYEERAIIYQPLYYTLESLVLNTVAKINSLVNGDCNFFFVSYSLRFFSLVISLLTFFVFLKSAELLPLKNIGKIIFVFLITLHPMLSSAGTYINPEVLMVFFSSCMFYLFAKSLMDKKIASPLLFFIVIVLSFSTKITAYLFLIWFAIFFLYLRKSKAVRFWRREYIFFSVLLFPLLIIYLLIFRGHIVVLNFLIFSGSSLWNQGYEVFRYMGILFDNSLHFTFQRFWGVWGWLQWYMPKAVYIVLGVITIISGIGISSEFITASIKKYKLPFLAYFSIFCILSYLLILVTYEFSLWVTDRGLFIQGRYLLLLEFPIMFLMAFGLQSVFYNLKSKIK